MKTLRFDSIGGASGDMILGVLCDLGVSARQLEAAIATLPIETVHIQADPCKDKGITGTRMTVAIQAGHHHHDAPHAHHHHHRTMADIRNMIQASGLPERTKAGSIRVFERLAAAEARIHDTTPDQVHFHEVGAVDSIVDIIGACLGLEWLGIERILVNELPAGHGTIQCQHGIIPNPAPATVELIKDHPVIQTDEPFELVTPTGAALLMTWQADYPVPGHERKQPSRIIKAGYGFGNRQLNHRANFLRGVIMESDAIQPAEGDCVVMECNLDDTLPEVIGHLARQLLELGALDVFTTPVQMKKQRPGTLLTVLCQPAQRTALINAIFRESTTFGIREHTVSRTMLERRHETVNTPYGAVRIKIGRWQGEDITRSPEYEDCAQLAAKCGVALRLIYEAALRGA
jgi:hypothetical protein